MNNLFSIFVTCPRGLESILNQELLEQGASEIEVSDGGVACLGNWETIYRINLHSRTASRVLLRVVQGHYRHEDDIYRLARRVNWQDWFQVSQTFKVKVEGKRARVKSLDFIALKIKDAVCDVFRNHVGERPSIDKQKPDVRIHAFINEQQINLLIDTSGEALFKRGYRQETGEAPLRENLAAGLLLLAGYDGSQAFQDPFCGSGTLAIEAAWIAQKRAAGLMRKFGFENLIPFDRALWIKLKAQAREQIIEQPNVAIAASDTDRTMIRLANMNAQAAQVQEWIQFSCQDAQDCRPNGEVGIMVSNPPYGVRLEQIQVLQALYPQLGSWLKQYYAGWTIGMFTGDRAMPKLMRLSPKRKIPLFNGNLDCRLFLLEMVKGSNR